MGDNSETKFITGYKPGPDAVVELKNGRVVDVINGRYLEKGTRVLIRGKRILSLPGPASTGQDITPDFYMDLKGKTVLPGLFNTHCHIQMLSPTLLATLKDTHLVRKYRQRQLEKNMRDCLARGITNIRDAMSEDLRLNRDLQGRIARNELPGPRITQSVIVTQPDGYLSQAYGLGMRFMRSVLGMPTLDFADRESGILVFPLDADEKTVREAVDRAVEERGAQAIKVPEQRMNMSSLKHDLKIMAIEQLEALTDQTRKHGIQSTIHQVTIETYRRGITSSISSFAHMARDADLSEEDVKAFIAADCIVEPTLSVGYDVAWPFEGDPAGEHPNMKLLSAYREKVFTFADLADEFYIPELRESVKQSYDRFIHGRLKLLGLIDMTKLVKTYTSLASFGVENVKKLYRHGARMALANDGGIPPCTPAMMGHELALFDLFLNHDNDPKRFSGKDALKVATINSACSMGLDDRFGSIEPGKTADLAVVDGDPFEDFRLVGSPVSALFMDGRLVIDNCNLEITSF